MPERKIRVIVAKPGLDGHDRGAKVISHGLRDLGYEVIYTGLHQTPEDIVKSVIQEDPDALLLSILSGAHRRLFPRIIELLKENDINDVLVLGGGIIPDQDVSFLKNAGIQEIFGSGTTIEQISEYIKTHLKR